MWFKQFKNITTDVFRDISVVKMLGQSARLKLLENLAFGTEAFIKIAQPYFGGGGKSLYKGKKKVKKEMGWG